MSWKMWKVGEKRFWLSGLPKMKISSEDEKTISEMTRMLEHLDEEDKTDSSCSSCGFPAAPDDLYCSACGHEIRKKERPKVIVRRITIV